MKKILIFVILILVIGLVGIPTIIYRIVEEAKIKFEKLPEGFVGPGGCRSEKECESFCLRNPRECQLWCQKNPEICEKYKPKIEEEFIGYIGCKKPENLERCEKVCEENFRVCRILPEENFTIELVPKPNLTLDYYKGLIVNLFIVPHREKQLLSIVKGAKEINANIISIGIETNPEFLHGVTNFSSYFEKEKEKRAKLIELAHKNGLQVNIGLNCYIKDKEGNLLPLSDILACVREEAKEAQKLNVYQLVTFGEVDVPIPIEKLNEYAPEILKEIRKYYNGRIGIGFCCVDENYISYNLSIDGYDFLEVSVYSQPEDETFEKFFEGAIREINLTRQVANKHGIKEVLLGETGVCDPNQKDPDGKSECDFFTTMPITPETEALYYEGFFNKTANLLDGYFIFYVFPIMSIKDEPAEDVVKEWYGKLRVKK